MRFKKPIPNIVYNTIPNGVKLMEPPDTTKHVQTNIRYYGENLDMNSNTLLEYFEETESEQSWS